MQVWSREATPSVHMSKLSYTDGPQCVWILLLFSSSCFSLFHSKTSIKHNSFHLHSQQTTTFINLEDRNNQHTLKHLKEISQVNMITKRTTKTIKESNLSSMCQII